MFPVVAIVGSRQCGKSTFVQALRPDWKYYDLENWAGPSVGLYQPYIRTSA